MGRPDAKAEQHLERFLGQLLRLGVSLAAAVVLLGGGLYLLRHAAEPRPPYVFHDPPAEWTTPAGILRLACRGDERGLIQLGLLLLIATPVARVLFSALAFARQRDWLYVALTLMVLSVLLYSFFLGEFGG